MNYFISDLHFYHKNVLDKLDNRGFASLEEMHNYIIKKWNKKVGKNHDVYILGDFSWGNVEQTEELLKKLNGRKHLIIGNHDYYLQKKTFDKSLFCTIRDYAEIQDNHRNIILSHYPIMCYNKQYRQADNGEPKTYMLYGHVHNTKDQTLIDIYHKAMLESGFDNLPPFCMINTFCMFSDYEPLTLDEWIVMEEARFNEFLEKNKDNNTNQNGWQPVKGMVKLQN